jgi:hypothetical protein
MAVGYCMVRPGSECLQLAHTLEHYFAIVLLHAVNGSLVVCIHPASKERVGKCPLVL